MNISQKACLAVAAALVSSIAFAAPAVAAEGPYWAPLQAWFDEHGVDDATQDELIAKLAAGEVLDSMKPTAEPVSVDVSENGHSRISTFEDGSIVVDEIRQANDGVGTFAISGCSYYNGSGYASASGCLIVSGNGMLELRFRASYSWGSFGGSIGSATSPEAVVLYGSATSPPSLSIVRANSSGSLPAVATAHTLYTHQNGTYSEDMYLSLRVDSTGGWTTQY